MIYRIPFQLRTKLVDAVLKSADLTDQTSLTDVTQMCNTVKTVTTVTTEVSEETTVSRYLV